MGRRQRWACTALAAVLVQAVSAASEGTLADLSLEELSDLRITSVSRRSELAAQAPASVFVIGAQEIRRSGATTLPEALRLAPNLLVARINGHDHVVSSSRGFLSGAGAKLLVMIDGRSIYTPLFSGVLWEAHDLMLEDVERIEVISGPGGTTWGTNAVTGIINVVTRSAAATHGALLAAHGGRGDAALAARWGGPAGRADVRVYGKATERDNFRRADGSEVPDSGWRRQAGFRADAPALGGGITVQGDVYQARRASLDGPRELNGINLLGRWIRFDDSGAGLSLQAYADRAERADRGLTQTMDIVDVEGQVATDAMGAHRFTAGAGWREADDRTVSGTAFVFLPERRRLRWLNVYLQDEIALAPALRLTVGVRAERNSYTGWETMPGARLAWHAGPGRLLWASASRALRSPSRIDRDFYQPGQAPFTLIGNSDFQSEIAKVLEVGWRAQPAPTLSYSITGFVHQHDRLRSVETRQGVSTLGNRLEGRTRGVEGWGHWQALPHWRLSGGFALIEQRLHPEPGSTGNPFVEANDPSHRWLLRSSLDLGPQAEFDLTVRRMGELPSPQVPAHTALDARLAWRPNPRLELALTGRNLGDRGHPEFGSVATRAEIPRSLLLSLRLALH
jgi:iron complex outermembrane receptor protein